MWPVVGNRLDVLERPPRRSLGDLFRPVDSHRRMHDDQNVFGVDGSAFVPSSVDDLSPDFIRRPPELCFGRRRRQTGPHLRSGNGRGPY